MSMILNLLSDPWIPVLRDEETITIRPDQIAEPGITDLAWQRPDFNLACLELLIGLVTMADPPENEEAWLARMQRPDAERLREALRPFDFCFQLSGEGPRFLQDLEPFEREAKDSDIKPVDMLYIDSAGDQTMRNNADLMVKRNRFASLAPAEAAMALYTLQAFAPSGGKGNRTSLRGGGPMTTLVRPLDQDPDKFPLWQLVYANVRPGSPLAAADAAQALPWLRPTRTSRKGEFVTPGDTHDLEAFFAMPRRLRLVLRGNRIVGVVQKPYGTNYEAWEHPLTPYYRPKEDDPQWLPVHPRPGRLSYRNWLGITMEPDERETGTRRPARTVHEIRIRAVEPPDFELMVGGWSTDNMKPVSFTLDTYPGFPKLDKQSEFRVGGLVKAANSASGALRKALKAACTIDGASADTAIETFFAQTEADFEASVVRIAEGAGTNVEVAWHGTLRDEAVRIFDERVLGGLTEHDIAGIERRIIARRNLFGALAKRFRKDLGLPMPGKKEKRT